MGADNGKPALSSSLWRVLVEARAKASGVVWVSRCLFSCGITRRVRENKDRFDFNIMTDSGGIVLPDKEDVTREGDWEFFFHSFHGGFHFHYSQKIVFGGRGRRTQSSSSKRTPRK